MKRRLSAAIALLALGAAACGAAGSAHPPTVAKHLVAANVAMARPATDLDYGPLATGTRQFGFALAKQLAPNAKNGNLVFSPTSLAIALSMLREGTTGATSAAIDRVLHLPADRHAAYNGLVRALEVPGGNNTLDMSNGLFLDPSLPVHPSYLAALKRWYGAGVYSVAFPNPALSAINSYVDTNTQGRIPHLIESLDRRDVFALVNTVYLKAEWVFPFVKSSTFPMPFTTADGSRVSAEMMRQGAQLDYASGPGWQAVRLPYAEDRLSMWVMLPTGSTPAVDLLAPTVLQAAFAGFERTQILLDLPKWNTDNKFDLKTTLETLGLGSLFELGGFGGITDTEFKVSAVVQQANIMVTERGTVAAAATEGSGMGGSAPVSPTATFDANHPFAYAIVDNTTGTPLFEGTVSDPS